MNFRRLSHTDAAALVATPLTGKTIMAGMFLLARLTFRDIDHPQIVR
ncbi:MAG: hypothetical protein JSW69_00015 [Deltaproteobacteria bacterium]|nr:MAG: hypothetical protein JSW69_00015 [Deltaproteobacteria bacterium]